MKESTGSFSSWQLFLCILFACHFYGTAGLNVTVIGITARSSEYGARVIEQGVETDVILFGGNFTNQSIIAFTTDEGKFGDDCDDLSKTDPFHFSEIIRSEVGIIRVTLNTSNIKYHVCSKSEDQQWKHQGSAEWATLEARGKLMPIWLSILLVCFLLCLSGLFAGLNLGLMSLDKNELKVIALQGTEEEKIHARTIEPIRRKGNYLLCTILLSNVMINSTTTVILDSLTSGVIAVIVATLSIVILGDIIPQAICSRHGLAVGAKTIYITYFFMFITFPLSYPISKILDFLLGDEIGQVYDRQKLMEFIRVTTDYSKLEEDEVKMITGALSLKQKKVEDVMTRLEDVFMLNITSILDFETVSMIQSKGYSRIPVYEEDRKNISMVKLFHAKDLAFVDPNDAMPIRTLLEFYNHEPVVVDAKTPVSQVLTSFKEGKSHLALVKQCFGGDDCDPVWEMVGVVTLEDVIEEILQSEIVDETDTLSDNRQKKRRKCIGAKDFTDFSKIGGGKESGVISPQMALAAYQFLSCAIPAFQESQLSAETLRKLMAQKIYFLERIHIDEEGVPDKTVKLYEEGKICDYFILIIEGRVKVTVGKERLVFISGPFSYFGAESLSLKCTEFVPDYSVEIAETTTYIKITRSVYMFAYQAHKMQQANSELAITRTMSDAGEGSIDSGIKSPASELLSRSISPSPDSDSTETFHVNLDDKEKGQVSVEIEMKG